MSWILLVLQLLPHILAAVTAIEEKVGPGDGPLKNKLLVETVKVGAEMVTPEPGTTPEQKAKTVAETVAVASIIANQTVEILNAAGVFKKSTPAAAK